MTKRRVPSDYNDLKNDNDEPHSEPEEVIYELSSISFKAPGQKK